MPSNPSDAYHLLRQSIIADTPTIFIEHKMLYNMEGYLDKNTNPNFGKANIKKKGCDISIISYSRMTNFALKAAEELDKEGISAEIVDLRTLNPLDKNTIIESVKKTKHALVLSEGHYTAGVAGELTSIIFENCFKELNKPVIRYASEDTPVPVAPNLEKKYIPTIDNIVLYCKKILDK